MLSHGALLFTNGSYKSVVLAGSLSSGGSTLFSRPGASPRTGGQGVLCCLLSASQERSRAN